MDYRSSVLYMYNNNHGKYLQNKNSNLSQATVILLIRAIPLLRLLQPKTTLLIRPDFIYDVIQIYTHYIHSVVVQDFVSGRACCVNQYHYELLSRRVVMWYVHTTGKT